MFSTARTGLALCLVLFMTACASTRKIEPMTVQESANIGGEAMREASRAQIQETEVSSEDVEKNVERPYKSAYGEIALDDNEHVQMWVRYFQGRGRHHMDLYLARSSRYLPMMKNVLRENGLPEELVYIALIESGFSPRAHSRANAVGYWQFIRSTGKRFGMQIDTFTDERRDPVLSTRAAAEYFKALHNLLGSWHLAMASYNVGEGRVLRATRKYGTKDFWALIKKRRALPAETRHYVPKFIAATMIAKDPAKYGFSNIEYQDPLSYDTVALQSPISLSKLASNINVDIEELKLLNPKFRTDFVPISRGTETVVRIPVGRATDALAALSLSVTTQPKILNAEHFYYRIRRGDTLSTIARKHRTTVSQLRRLNDLSNRTLLRVGRSIKVPDNGGEIKVMVEEESSRRPAGGGKTVVSAVDTRPTSTHHVVRRGDNLSTIARRYGLSMSELLKLNNINTRSVIRKGQKLRVRPDSAPTSAKIQPKRSTVALAEFRSQSASKKVAKELASQSPRRMAASSSVKDAARKHKVRRGETLYDVSKKYGVTLAELARANNVKWNHRVMAGEKLMIP
ncbi:MAG TPA: LysM peptidoglycan-binding domain-containing protein [Bdellovibrionales bacterium]|mgnify:CR=1 FL=1|nr:LysM peptidoglycan-binding domain-containing protein [Bdellovibrionales bacterium]